MCRPDNFSCVQLFVILWTVAHQTPLPMEILQARTLEWVASPLPGDLPNPGFHTQSLTSPAGWFFSTSTIWEVQYLL